MKTAVVVPKRTALAHFVVGLFASATLLGLWPWAQGAFGLPDLSSGGGIAPLVILFPALVGFGQVARSFRIPLRIGVVMLGLVALVILVAITWWLVDRPQSHRTGLVLALVWALAGVVAILLSRAWRAGRPHA